MIVVGLLSGTSVDAIDVAVGAFGFGVDGTLTLTPLGHAEHPWPGDLRSRILAVLPPAAVSIGEVCALDNEIGQAFAAVARSAVSTLAGGRAELVASLGQTVFHDVRGSTCHGTLQLGQPAWIAEATGLPVVSDLRAADIAAGGHGAPLASTLDALWLAATPGPAAALNLGGIANATVVRPAVPAGLPAMVSDAVSGVASGVVPGPASGEVGAPAPGQVLAFDTGPASCLLDLAAVRVSGGTLSCDLDGALALAGTVRADLLAVLLDEPYFDLAPPKSCGRELFDAGYLDRALAAVPAVADTDLMATLTEFTARTVADALAPYRPAEVVVSGGGVRNPALLAALRRRLPGPDWCASDDRGLPSDGKEAYLVALLGALTWHGLPGTASGATGARHPTVLGRITPPRAYPRPTLMTTLRVTPA